MKRARLLLLLLLVPANAASLWALPQCETVLVCQMGPDGGSCCPEGGRSMEGCQDSDHGAMLILLPATAPAAAPRIAPLVLFASVEAGSGEGFLPISLDVLHPPPRG